MFTRRARVRRRMDVLAGEITRSLESSPDGFDAREALWIERENLRGEYNERPTPLEHMFEPRNMPAAAIGCATTFNLGGGWFH